ncbi:MAG TPA: WG repeat-containing protein [Ohtaekwangia sp.]|uniref:WG repeat-containing protein n=1 Tax=Ohtaekwangia sp. TaxID=2066019 RepID=UPI002F9592A0
MKTKTLYSLACVMLITWHASSQTLITQVKPADSKKWGYANLKGEIIIQPQYEKCYEFSSDGYAPIYDTKVRQYYFINTKGEKLATEIKDFKLIDGLGFDLKGFEDGLVPIRQGEKWGYLDTNGKIAIPAKYEHTSAFNGGHAIVEKDSKFIVIDKHGNETTIDIPGVLDVKPFAEKLAPFRAADKKFGFINEQGKVAIPAQFESVGYFSGGLAWAKSMDKKVGYINTAGEWIIKPQFDVAKEFDAKSGMARVKNADQWAYVNKSGSLVYVKDTNLWGDFSNGLAQGRKNDKVGFFNTKGEWVIEPKFDATRDFKNGYAAAKQGDKWGLIDTKGDWVIQPTFDGIKDMELVGN